VRHTEGNLCIDPVLPEEQVLSQIERLGVAKILLTNRNHARAANLVRERTGAPILISPDDAQHAKDQGTTIDGALSPGDAIGPLTVVSAAGKSPGEVAFYWPARRLLFVGDVVICNPPGRCSLLREKVMDDPARLRRSVVELAKLDFDVLLVGDGVPLLDAAKPRLLELVQTFAS
jgi:glyoxylase-like metal-dependent hydrolase (beta-lactamase superfamily II)